MATPTRTPYVVTVALAGGGLLLAWLDLLDILDLPLDALVGGLADANLVLLARHRQQQRRDTAAMLRKIESAMAALTAAPPRPPRPSDSKRLLVLAHAGESGGDVTARQRSWRTAHRRAFIHDN